MKYGICPLSIIPLRAEASDKSELVSQVLYGETFKVVEHRKKWSKVRLFHDRYEGWLDNKQIFELSKESYQQINQQTQELSQDMVDYVTNSNGSLITIPLGSSLNGLSVLNHRFDGRKGAGASIKSGIVDTAILYLNCPYLWGGRTPFGIDCSGFTQMVYKLNGFNLLRDASMQATQGEALSFIEESEPGDLAFFDNAEGDIIHVGIILEDHHIIHAHGQVRIDRLDHTGIFNTEKRQHTHKLRVIKRIV